MPEVAETLDEKEAKAIGRGVAWVILIIKRSPLLSAGLVGIVGLFFGGTLGSSVSAFSHGTKSTTKMDSVLKILGPMSQDSRVDHLELKCQGKEIRKLRGSFLELKGARQASMKYEEKDRAYQQERRERGDTTSSEASPDSVERLVSSRHAGSP